MQRESVQCCYSLIFFSFFTFKVKTSRDSFLFSTIFSTFTTSDISSWKKRKRTECKESFIKLMKQASRTTLKELSINQRVQFRQMSRFERLRMSTFWNKKNFYINNTINASKCFTYENDSKVWILSISRCSDFVNFR